MEKKIDIQSLRNFLRANKRPLTVERAALFEVMLSMKGHYSAEEFYKAALKESAVCDKTTVYKILPLFVKAGFIKEASLPNSRKRYARV